LTGLLSGHFFRSIPRLIASTLNYLEVPKYSSKLQSQLALLFKIGTYSSSNNSIQSLFGLRVSIQLDTSLEYIGHEVHAPLFVETMHYWDVMDDKFLEKISGFSIFECLFNAPEETLKTLFGSSFMKRHGKFLSRYSRTDRFTSLVNELQSALNLSTMERTQFLKLASLVVLLLDSEHLFLEHEQTTLGGVLNPQMHNDRIRKYILSLPSIVLDEVCQLFGPDCDKWTLVSKVETLSKSNNQSRFFSSLAQYVHRALFNWTLSKISKIGRGIPIEGGFNWNFVWLPQHSQYLTSNVAVEHLHAWAVRYLCESEELSMKHEGFEDWSCNVWRSHGVACQIVEQFMNEKLDVSSLSQRFTINHSFGSIVYNNSLNSNFNAEDLVAKLRQIIPLNIVTSVPHFCHVLFLGMLLLYLIEIITNIYIRKFSTRKYRNT
jgi:hypothetical protein